MLRDNDLTLDKAVETSRAAEVTKLQLQKMKGHRESREHKSNASRRDVHIVRKQPKRAARPAQSRSHDSPHTHDDSRDPSRMKACGWCAGTHGPKQCPGWGHRCRKCGKLNNLEKFCRSTPRAAKVHELGADEYSSDDGGFFIESLCIGNIIQGNEDDSWFAFRAVPFKMTMGGGGRKFFPTPHPPNF